jgi:hypothetical protein
MKVKCQKVWVVALVVADKTKSQDKNLAFFYSEIFNDFFNSAISLANLV